MQVIELKLDVSQAAGLGEEAFVAATVFLPEPDAMPLQPVICIAKPGGGFSRRYYSDELPGVGEDVSQAAWHVRRGWIFVCLDHLGVGDSSTHHDPSRLDYISVPAANDAAIKEILRRLATRELSPEFPRIIDPVRIGLGQSMGGSLTVVQQGRYHCYDGIAVLGFSAVHTHPAVPGVPSITFPWLVRENLPATVPCVLNPVSLSRTHSQEAMLAINRKLFFYDDLDEALINRLLKKPAAVQGHGEKLFPWQSASLPLGVIARCLTPGVIAQEAAAVTVPVLVAMGERDVIADPKGEARAYLSATSVDLFICPRMGHMHNFATTREIFWQRIHAWGEWVREYKLGHTIQKRS